MSSESAFNMTTFTDTTRKVCTFSALSIFLVLLPILTPLNRVPWLAGLVKLVTVALLGYTIYLNIVQTNSLRRATSSSHEVSSQLTVNIASGYVFALFLGLLIVFVIKGM